MIDITKQYTSDGRPVTQLVKFKTDATYTVYGVAEGAFTKRTTSNNEEVCGYFKY